MVSFRWWPGVIAGRAVLPNRIASVEMPVLQWEPASKPQPVGYNDESVARAGNSQAQYTHGIGLQLCSPAKHVRISARPDLAARIRARRLHHPRRVSGKDASR